LVKNKNKKKTKIKKNAANFKEIIIDKNIKTTAILQLQLMIIIIIIIIIITFGT